MRNPFHAGPPSSLTIVIKLGTSSIIHPETHQPLLSLLSSIVETICALRAQGHRVVLVSSGAIGVGMKRMGVRERGKGLAGKQALAAIGQGRLIALWDNLFSQLSQPIAQILLTRGDISDRTRYLNAVNTLTELLSMGVVPIVNENDTISVSEIKFGDNDTLSAITSNMVHADYLFLMTDVDCLYTDNPRKNPDAKAVRVVKDIAEVRKTVSTATLGTSLGTGGMETKIIAAELATGAGVTTVILNSKNIASVFPIVAMAVGARADGAALAAATAATDGGWTEEDEARLPAHTRFIPMENPLNDRKWWILHGLHSAGAITIDQGAFQALTRRESGGRLLPAGVLKVEGSFASLQAVRIIVRLRKDRSREPRAGGNTSGDERRRSSAFEDAPSSGAEEDGTASGQTTIATTPSIQTQPTSPRQLTAPGTPRLGAAASLSSSVVSLDPPLSQSIEPASSTQSSLSPEASVASSAAASLSAALSAGVEALHVATSSQSEAERPKLESTGSRETIKPMSPKPTVSEEDWDYVEVGKGQVHYNSSEIDRVKGLKTSEMSSVLGYADTEHVVDSITLKSSALQLLQ